MPTALILSERPVPGKHREFQAFTSGFSRRGPRSCKDEIGADLEREQEQTASKTLCHRTDRNFANSASRAASVIPFITSAPSTTAGPFLNRFPEGQSLPNSDGKHARALGSAVAARECTVTGVLKFPARLVNRQTATRGQNVTANAPEEVPNSRRARMRTVMRRSQ